MSKNTSTSAYKILTNPTKHMGVMSDIIKKLGKELKSQGFRFDISGESTPLVNEWFGYITIKGATKTLIFVLGYDDAAASVRYISVSNRKYDSVHKDGFVPGVIMRALKIIAKEPPEGHYSMDYPIETKKELVESYVENIHEFVIDSTCPAYCHSYDHDEVMFKWLVNAACQGKPQALAHLKQYILDDCLTASVRERLEAASLTKLKPFELSDALVRAGAFGVEEDEEDEDED